MILINLRPQINTLDVNSISLLFVCSFCSKQKKESQMSRFTGNSLECRSCSTKRYVKETGYKKINKAKVGNFECISCNKTKDGSKMKTYTKCESCCVRARYEKNPQSWLNKLAWQRNKKYPHLKRKQHAVRSKRVKNASRCLSKNEKILVQNFYLNCPEGYEVDHIIPINHKNVSGLNVLANLQYLPKSENSSKKNKWDGTYNNMNWKQI